LAEWGVKLDGSDSHDSQFVSQSLYALTPVQWERGLRERFGGERHHRPWIVIARDAIRAQVAARFAAVDDRPFTVLPHPDGDRFHARAARRHAIAGRVVQVQTPQAVRAMIAMPRAIRFSIDWPTTPPAHEVVALVATTMILTTQWNTSFDV
jgi:hypothetical protein